MRLVSFLFLTLLAGCTFQQGSRVGDPPLPQEVQPQFVAVLTEGVTIHAEDGSWSLAAGDDPLPPPYATQSLGVSLGEAPAANQFVINDGQVLRVAGKRVSLDQLLEMSEAFLAAGARRVRVQVPGRDKALYGVLALTPCNKDTDESSARRSYRISVPQVRVQQALGAQIALVCQPYRARVPVVRAQVVPTTDPFASNTTMWNEVMAVEDAECVTWILWLSDAPFAGHDPNWEPPR